MSITTTIAPRQVVRGWDVTASLGERLAPWGKRILVISGATTRQRFMGQLAFPGLQVTWVDYGVDCTEAIHRQLTTLAGHQDLILGLGGGKALDLAKWVAHSCQLPVVTVPTSAATCAAWAPLSNVYSAAGTWRYGVPLGFAPELLLLDYRLILTAPQRTLIAGIGDALAKWYEASVSSNQATDPLIVSAVQQARTLRDLLLLNSQVALADPGGPVWEQIVDANICLAGLVGGLGGDQCRTVAAHAVHNALTTLPATRQSLHGEKVAFGILVQLRLEEKAGNRLAEIARQQLVQFYRQIGLPCCLEDLGLGELPPQQLQAVAEHCCQPGSDLHLLPFPVTPQDLVSALVPSALTASRDYY